MSCVCIKFAVLLVDCRCPKFLVELDKLYANPKGPLFPARRRRVFAAGVDDEEEARVVAIGAS